MIDIKIPHDPAVATKFFGRFTAKDITRLALPALVAYALSPDGITGTAVTVVIGLSLGTMWYWYKPYDRTVDEHLTNAASWLIEHRTARSSDVESIEQQHIETADGTLVAGILVEPTNLDVKSADEQAATHDIYKELLETVSYPIKVHSLQHIVHLDDYIETIEEQDVDLKRLQTKYAAYCEEFSADELRKTVHIISVRASSSSPSETLWSRVTSWLPFAELSQADAGSDSENELDRRQREIRSTLESADLSTRLLSTRNLKTLRDKSPPNPSDVAPRYIQDRDDPVTKRRSAVITGYPAQLSLAWTQELLDVDGEIEVTQIVEPKDAAATTSTLQRGIEKLSAEIGSWMNAGYLGTNDLEAKLDDANWMLNLLTDREDKPVSYRVVVTAVGNTRTECDRRFRKVCDRLETMQISYREPVWQTHDVYRQQSPLHRDTGDGQLMPSRSAAAGFPFTTAVTRNDAGIVFGESRNSGDPVLMDRYEWSSHSIARMGMVGSGKSYAAKLEVMRSWLAYDDLQVYIVDPKKEYTDLVANLDGRTYDLQEESHRLGFKTADIISYEVNDRGQEENVDALVDVVRQIYDFASRSTDKTLVLIDEARILLNDPEGRRVLNQFVLEARDTNTAITMITQNASHFTYCREGREILDNVPGKIFMRHDRVPDSVIDYFQLSRREVQQLYKLKTGTDASYSEALLKVTDRTDTPIRIESTAVEHAIIDSGRE